MYNPTHKHDFMAEGLMIPFCNQTDLNRVQMFNSHSGQMIQMVHSDFPYVFTGFENQIGKYSTGYKTNDQTQKIIIKKFVKNQYVYYLLTYDPETQIYDVIERKEAEVLTEYYGAKFDNTGIDKLKEGDQVDPDYILYHDCNYDEELNFKYGKNINVAYLPYKGYTNEDAIVISKSAAKAMGSYFSQDIEVNINTNDVLLNMYGDPDKKEYKAFPNVGEAIRAEDGILLSMRKVIYDEVINKLSDDQLAKKLDDDIHFYADRHARVIDLDIFSNVSLESLETEPYSLQIAQQLSRQREFYREVLDFLTPLMKDPKTKFTPELREFYNRVAEFADPLTEFERNGRRFDKVILRFRLLWEKPLTVGSKITQRYGGKGVISKIVDDEDMPVLNTLKLHGEEVAVRPDTQLKFRADVVINSQGVFNRLNPSQLTEQFLNYIMLVVRYNMETMDPLEAKDYLLEVIRDIDSGNEVDDNFVVYKDYLDSLDETKLKEVLDDYIQNGISLKQEPFFRNVNVFHLYDVAMKYGIEEGHDERIDEKFIVAPIYYIRLKHEASGKFSAKSIDNNNMVDLPTKNKDKRNSTSPISNTPIKLGEMEVTDLGLVGSLGPVKELLDQYANNSQARKELIYNLLTSPSPYNLQSEGKPVTDLGNNNKVLNMYLLALGVKYTQSDEDPLLDKLINLNPEDLDRVVDYLQEHPDFTEPELFEFLDSLQVEAKK